MEGFIYGIPTSQIGILTNELDHQFSYLNQIAVHKRDFFGVDTTERVGLINSYSV